MPQQIVYTDDVEDKIVMDYSKEWKLSKADTIKKIIKDFKSLKKIIKLKKANEIKNAR